MYGINFKDIKKTYDNNKTVIEDLNLEIKPGEFTVLLGPSGCGKTTLLRMLGGLEEVTKGDISIGEEDVTFKKAEDRGIAMVFQNYAIYPHMTVKENIEFGLINAKIPKEEREKIIDEVVELVDLKEYLDVKPSKMSGGQRQRIALARAISKHPKVFLMDEPLSNLDAKLRNQMRSEIIMLHQRLKTTFVYVTHDQVEAMTMGDRIVIMKKGKIMQVGTPHEIYNNPKNVFVATFIGNPGMNINKIKNYHWGFRPRSLKINADKKEDGISFKGKVLTRELLGSEVLYYIDTIYGRVMGKTNEETYSPGEEIDCYVEFKNMCLFDKEGERIYERDSIEEIEDCIYIENKEMQKAQ